MSLFDNNPQTPVVDENTDFLAALVGEGKKFKDVSDLAKGKAEADAYIERLKAENAGVREELTKRDRLQELIDRLEPKSQPPQQQQEHNQKPNAENPEAFDPSKLNEIVEKMLSERDKRSAAEKNIEAVMLALSQKLGPQYREKLVAKSRELGVSPEWMTSVAEQSPNAFYNLIGLNAPQSREGFTPPAGGRQSSFEPANPNRDKKYYDALKARNSAEYWSPTVQNQMHKDALAQGEKFFS